MTKTCNICKVEKEMDSFPFFDRKNNIKRANCFDCYHKKQRDRYWKNVEINRQRNKESYLKYRKERIISSGKWAKANPEKIKIYSKKFRVKTQEEWKEFKSLLVCSNCNENHPSCLEFHHVNPDEKEGLITKLRFSKKRLEKELKKCVVLCSNCHRKHHWEEINV